jgi:short-subunit dehydrogenase
MTVAEKKPRRKETAPGEKARRALITGASSGIGEEFARQLAKRRYDLVLVARRQDRMERLAEELGVAHGVNSEVIAADLARAEDVSAVAKRLLREDIRMLVNSAGFGTLGDFVELPIDRELVEIDVNVRALTRLSHAAAEVMVRGGGGTIINIASTAAFQAVPGMATYAATKAYVLAFSEALHEELKDHGVTVTCLCPGPVRTEFQEVAGVDGSRLRIGWTRTEHVVAAALRGARAGKAIVVPGTLSNTGAMTAKLAPRFLARKVAGAMFRRRGLRRV